MKIRKATYQKILTRWEKCEFLIFAEKLKFKKKKISNLTGKSFSSIPSDVKLKSIKSEVKDLLKSYQIKLRNFSIIENMYSEAIKDFRRQESVILEYNPIKPKPPNILEYFTDDLLTNLIQRSLRERFSWKSRN